ncbi:MAG: hypothetical protein EOO43_21155 [Flavobacterium sp.]|nr:MAG: hypothetical protein EOO43_21155 [Flavobacterium sp.]
MESIAAANRNDLSQIRQHFEELILWLKKADIPIEGLFLNADAGFDSQRFRETCYNYQIQPNIAFNTRNAANIDRFDYFDELLYQNRFVIERAFAWLDAFKALLIRYETTALNWLCLNIIGMAVCFIRKIYRTIKC